MLPVIAAPVLPIVAALTLAAVTLELLTSALTVAVPLKLAVLVPITAPVNVPVVPLTLPLKYDPETLPENEPLVAFKLPIVAFVVFSVGSNRFWTRIVKSLPIIEFGSTESTVVSNFESTIFEPNLFKLVFL